MLNNILWINIFNNDVFRFQQQNSCLVPPSMETVNEYLLELLQALGAILQQQKSQYIFLYNYTL